MCIRDRPDTANGELLTTTNPKDGNIIQVVGNMDATAGSGGFSTTSTTYVTNSVLPSQAITPSKSSSKIYVSAFIGKQNDATGQCENTIYRAISGGATTELSGGNTYGLVFKGGSNAQWGYAGVQFVDSPNTTSEVTYHFKARVTDSSAEFQWVPANSNSSYMQGQMFTLWEIGV